jgi:CrcB protein
VTNLLLVAVGGAFGASLRYLVSELTLRLFGPLFPWGTLTVNLVGSLAMGLFIGWLVREEGGDLMGLRYLVATGFLGGFTTFSAFSLDVAVMWERGDFTAALSYVLASVVLSIAAVFLGLHLVRQVAL